jgi:hypothetical protein
MSCSCLTENCATRKGKQKARYARLYTGKHWRQLMDTLLSSSHRPGHRTQQLIFWGTVREGRFKSIVEAKRVRYCELCRWIVNTLWQLGCNVTKLVLHPPHHTPSAQTHLKHKVFASAVHHAGQFGRDGVELGIRGGRNALGCLLIASKELACLPLPVASSAVGLLPRTRLPARLPRA